MSEENHRTSRTDYRASVETGLRRLEAEKLSFLGTSNVISKFDPASLEEYSKVEKSEEDEDEMTMTMQEKAVSDVLLSETNTLNDVQDVQSVVEELGVSNELIIDPGELSEDDLSSGEQSVTNIADIFESGKSAASSRLPKDDDSVTLNFASIRSYRSQEDLAALSDDEDEVHDTDNVGAIAEKVREYLKSRESEEDSEDSETEDVGKIAAKVRQELTVLDGGHDLDSCETHVVGKAGSDSDDVETGEFNGVGDALKSGLTAQIMKPGKRPQERMPHSGNAMERLKQQGIFEPVPIIHHEVNKNIENIKGLSGIDKIVPESEVKNWNGSFETGKADPVLDEGEDCTIPQDPDAVDEIKHVAMLVKAAREAEAQGPVVVPVASVDDEDIESRKTMPINLTTLPEDIVNPKKESKKSGRRRSVSVEAMPAENADDDEDSTNTVVWVAVIVLLLAGIIYMLYLMGIFASISPILDPNRESELISSEEESSLDDIDVSLSFNTYEDVAEAVNSASSLVASSTDFDQLMPAYFEKKLNQTAGEEQVAYLELAHEFYPSDLDRFKKLIEACYEYGMVTKARQHIEHEPRTEQNSAYLDEQRMKLLLADPKFMPPVVDLTEEMTDTIDPLGGGSTLTFKMKLKGENVGAFKPHQTRAQSNYRSEIAAWRLCQLLDCDFDIPWNRPVRIEYNLFYKLYNRSTSKKKTSYRAEHKDIIWNKQGKVSYVYGTFKDWVPDFTRFPIELTSFWKPWLSQENYISEFKPLQEAFAPLKRNANTQKLLPELLEQSPNLTTKQIAAQVSEVLVFDYLVGNWDRFSGVPSWWGVNCQYKDNRIVSIDNGAAFPTYSNDKVRDRYLMAERFSAHYIEALRKLDKETTLRVLFPEPSDMEIKRFEQFWRQRESVLKRVDQLSKKYGADRVLSL